jgi:hypothetical protein
MTKDDRFGLLIAINKNSTQQIILIFIYNYTLNQHGIQITEISYDI